MSSPWCSNQPPRGQAAHDLDRLVEAGAAALPRLAHRHEVLGPRADADAEAAAGCRTARPRWPPAWPAAPRAHRRLEHERREPQALGDRRQPRDQGERLDDRLVLEELAVAVGRVRVAGVGRCRVDQAVRHGERVEPGLLGRLGQGGEERRVAERLGVGEADRHENVFYQATVIAAPGRRYGRRRAHQQQAEARHRPPRRRAGLVVGRRHARRPALAAVTGGVDRYWTSAEVAADGSAQVAEVIDYDFGLNQKRRHLPLGAGPRPGAPSRSRRPTPPTVSRSPDRTEQRRRRVVRDRVPTSASATRRTGSAAGTGTSIELRPARCPPGRRPSTGRPSAPGGTWPWTRSRSTSSTPFEIESPLCSTGPPGSTSTCDGPRGRARAPGGDRRRARRQRGRVDRGRPGRRAARRAGRARRPRATPPADDATEPVRCPPGRPRGRPPSPPSGATAGSCGGRAASASTRAGRPTPPSAGRRSAGPTVAGRARSARPCRRPRPCPGRPGRAPRPSRWRLPPGPRSPRPGPASPRHRAPPRCGSTPSSCSGCPPSSSPRRRACRPRTGGIVLREQVRQEHKVAWLIQAAIDGVIDLDDTRRHPHHPRRPGRRRRPSRHAVLGAMFASGPTIDAGPLRQGRSPTGGARSAAELSALAGVVRPVGPARPTAAASPHWSSASLGARSPAAWRCSSAACWPASASADRRGWCSASAAGC